MMSLYMPRKHSTDMYVGSCCTHPSVHANQSNQDCGCRIALAVGEEYVFFCCSTHHSWNALLHHVVSEHLPTDYPAACSWAGCQMDAKRMRPSLITHVQVGN